LINFAVLSLKEKCFSQYLDNLGGETQTGSKEKGKRKKAKMKIIN
jgi:hypothetical protein